MDASSTGVIQILLCDDHRLFREGAKRILDDEDDLCVIGEAATVEQAINLVGTVAPTVIVLDISFPGGNSGLDAVAAVREKSPSSKILIVSMHRDRSFVEAAFAQGATGYVTKDAAADDLAAAVRIVALGGRYIPDFLERPANNSTARRLTTREREVLELVALGHTNPEIAQLLHLSPRTIESYRSQLARKLNAGSRAELIRSAKEQGLL
ncbi:MAG: response regulator transcription factor [Actinomycetota bacterium]